MIRRLVPLLLLAFFASILSAAIPFPQENSDLEPDPAVRFGTLPNGLRYAIRPNKEPRDRAALRLLVETGSLQETEQQRGLAHFLEHMAFNGSAHYKPGTLVEFFQKMGMNFGGDTNANTSFERTVYLLDLPDTKPATMAEGLRVFSDYAGGLLLQEDEIDKERGIILSEKRTQDSVGFRTLIARLGFTLDGTRFPERIPIGEAEVIRNAKREQFLDFYNTWYRPERMSVVVVGDIDPAAVEAQLKEAFTPLKARAPARSDPSYGQLAQAQDAGVRTFYHYESEAPNTTVTIATITPYRKEPDTAAERVKYLPRSLAHAMLNRRISILAKKEGAPFIGGGASVGEAYNFYRETTMSLTCREDQWSAALGVAEQELRRALDHGFQTPELKEVVANFRNALEQAVKTAPTRRSEGLADELTDTLLERDVFTSPEEDLAVYGPALEKVTVQDCVAALREAWAAKHRLVLVTGNAKIGAAPADAQKPSAEKQAATSTDTAPEKEILSVFDRSRALAVAAPETMADTAWAYTNFGAPGKVAKREHVADLDVDLLQFENGVRLNLKKTDFEANRIWVNVRVGYGALTEPRDKPGLAFYTSATYTEGGLGKHSADDLRRILAGKTVGAGFGATADAFVIGGPTNREDLQLQMQLVTARLTDPGFRPEAARQVRKRIDQIYLSFEHTASGPFNLEVPKLLTSGDSRFGLPPKEVILQRNLDEVRAWTQSDLTHGPIEVAIVGDFDFDAVINAVAQTLGALPKRDERRDLAELKHVKFPEQPFRRDYEIPTEIPKGEVALYWPTTDGLKVQRSRRLNMLAEILNDRLRVKVREELGDAYSPGAGSSASDIYPGYGYIQAGVTVDPPKAQEVADIIAQLGGELAAKGVTDDELERAKKPVLTALRESARTNSYWRDIVLARAQERPESLDWCRTRYADNESITTAELSALAKQFLPAERVSRVIVVPKGGTAAAGQPAKKAGE